MKTNRKVQAALGFNPSRALEGVSRAKLAPRYIYMKAKNQVKGFAYKEELLSGAAGVVPWFLSQQGG